MSYICEALQFGSNQIRVPGYEEDLIASNKPNAPVKAKLVDPATNALWDLVFSFESGGFFLANAKVPGVDNATIASWYTKEGGDGIGHTLAFTPFIVDENGVGGFAQATHFVDFSQASPNDGSINTDTITGANVTATVHQELPEYANLSIASHATSQSIIITTTTTHAVFDKIFVYAGNSVPVGNTLTVPKAHSCYALAVFKKSSSTSSKEIGTIQFPRIPKSEWPMIIAQIVNEVILNEKGEVYEYLSPRLLASMDAATLKTAIAAISKHIDALGSIKTVIAGLGEKAGK